MKPELILNPILVLLAMQLHEDTRKLFQYDEASVINCEYQATQIFYTNEPQNAQEMDRITAVEYSRDGEHLAVGDHGGRIWIYSTNDGRNQCKPKPFRSFIEPHSDDHKDDDLLHERNARRPMDQNDAEEDDYKDPAGSKSEDTPPSHTLNRGLVYDFYGQFQSHQPEFDYLKSLEIEEKINCISWCRCSNNSLSLLACNDKTIKLWKVFEKKLLRAESGDSFHKKFKTHSALRSRANASSPDHPPFINDPTGFHDVALPTIECDDIITAAISRRVYQNGHKFHIHSLDVNCDCETFISADDLRINLWHFDSPSTSFNLCDLKPESMENLTNTVTKAILHPTHCNYMAYTTSQSQICVCDMRQNCKIKNNNTEFTDHRNANLARSGSGSGSPFLSSSSSSKATNPYGHSPNLNQLNGSSSSPDYSGRHQFASTKVFEYQQPLLHRDFFTDLAAYISDVTFSSDGTTMMSRDYFNIYVWDIRDNSKPLRIVPVHPYYANDMRHLYESDLLFDRFEIASSPSSMSVASGTYNNSFVVANWETNRIQKCVLNPNQVMVFQNRLKKQHKKLKKLKKLQKIKKQQQQQQAALSTVKEEDVDGDKEEEKEKGNSNNMMDVETETRSRADAVLQSANDDGNIDGKKERDPRDPRSGRRVKANSNRMNVDEEAVAEEEEESVKPPWLQSSYFQKGNFDQKALHLTWHPKKDVIAAVSDSQLLIFQKL